MPEVMKQSGAKLVEVGTTNRAHNGDYEQAFSEPAAAILRAHSSNFKIIGFTSQPSLTEMAEIARQHGALLIDDLGSGALIDTSKFGIAHEPMVQESLAEGADVVCFSGDKLLGGPQAGIILGKKELLDKVRKHPLARAVRADKLCLAALSATLEHYLKGNAVARIPIWQMITMKTSRIKARASKWKKELGEGEILRSLSTVGGGSLPEEDLPTYVLALTVSKPNAFLEELRNAEPAIIARIEENKVVFDPRTVLETQERKLLAGIHQCLRSEVKK